MIMKQRYMLKIRLNEFMEQLIHHYSNHVNRTMQDITTDALHEYLKSRIDSDEYKNILAFSKHKEKMSDQVDKQLNEDFFEYYNGLTTKQKLEFEEIYNRCFAWWAKRSKSPLSDPIWDQGFEVVEGYKDLPSVAQDRLHITVLDEYYKSKGEPLPDSKEPVDAQEMSDHWKRVHQDLEKKKKDEKKK